MRFLVILPDTNQIMDQLIEVSTGGVGWSWGSTPTLNYGGLGGGWNSATQQLVSNVL